MRKIRAMVVDDSAVVRKFLSQTLTSGGIDVIATAPDPILAWERIVVERPDVLVLDVEMPRMDGITFLRKIMAERPMPVVMCSTLTTKGAETTMQALAAGAVSFVTKPTEGVKNFLESGADNVVAAVKAAAQANLGALRPHPTPPPGPPTLPGAPTLPGPPTLPGTARARPLGAMAQTSDRVIAIGLSTGGVQSIERVLRVLPRTLSGIVIVQHMPEKFTATFAERLNRVCDIDVAEARHGDRVLRGRALIAPGGLHTRLARSGAQYVVEVVDGPNINHHKPSVDVLFRSVAQCAGANALGLIMTGMGDDGARGLRDMKEAGATTAAQDEASSIVFGMPKEAIKLGAAGTVLGLDQIAAWLQSHGA
jgi:two-component system chemotaxis response regulator CheB